MRSRRPPVGEVDQGRRREVSSHCLGYDSLYQTSETRLAQNAEATYLLEHVRLFSSL